MQRLNYYEHFKAAFEKMGELSKIEHDSSLDPRIRDLIKIYASQINGCAFCVDMHVKEAKIAGERELRIYHIPVWHESPLFTPKEKAALQWTQAITKLSSGPVSDEIFANVREHFGDKELTELTMAIGMINLWNRFAAPFATPPGSLDKAFGLEKANLA